MFKTQELSNKTAVAVNTNIITGTIIFKGNNFTMSLSAEESIELCNFILSNYHGIVADSRDTLQRYELDKAKKANAIFWNEEKK